jgi:hypothetical protein
MGVQVCKPDGGGYVRCNCAPTGDGSSGGMTDGGGIFVGDTGRGDSNGVGGDAEAMDSAGAGSDATGPALAPVSVSMSSLSALETEVQLAVAPDGTIAIAWIAVSAGQADSWIGYRFSTDAGATFSAIGRMQIPTGLSGSDPALAVDGVGNFYLSALGVHFVGTSPTANADYTRVFVAKAASGTTTFGAAVDVVSPPQPLLYDHPKILVTAKGTVVMGFLETQATADGGMPTMGVGRVATSKDGQTWQVGTIVGPPTVEFANLFWFCEGAGILYTTYLESTAAAGYIALRTSIDDGATWSARSAVISLPTEITAGLDPGCVAQGNDVWIAYATTASPATDPTNNLDAARAIRMAHSPDRGASLDTARVDALDTVAGTLGLFPTLVRELGGALDVAYVTGNSEGDTNGSVRYVRDAAGAAFGRSVAVDGPLTYTTIRSKSDWLGDYMGAVVSGGRLLVAYPINAGGITHVYFRSLALQ